MKNKTVECLKLSAKQYHRSRRGDHFDSGIRVFHLYNDFDPSRLSWWDDVTFILNDYRVALAWIHPRMAYEDMIADEVARITANFPAPDIMQTSTPTYKSAGKSRKTISSWKCAPVDRSDWLEHHNRTRQHVMQSANFQITPYLTSRWGPYSRLVTLCAPLEVSSEGELRSLAAVAKRLLKHEVSLEDLFSDYCYTKADWERDLSNLADACLHAHQLAI